MKSILRPQALVPAGLIWLVMCSEPTTPRTPLPAAARSLRRADLDGGSPRSCNDNHRGPAILITLDDARCRVVPSLATRVAQDALGADLAALAALIEKGDRDGSRGLLSRVSADLARYQSSATPHEIADYWAIRLDLSSVLAFLKGVPPK